MHINQNHIMRKYLKLSTKSVDLKKSEICGDQFKIEKGMNDPFTKEHRNSVYSFYYEIFTW